MDLKQLLLNGLSFKEILRQFSINNENDIVIKDEQLILSEQELHKKDILKERICIQGKSANGIVNFFGTLHCNLINQLAVFEPDFVEKNPEMSVN